MVKTTERRPRSWRWRLVRILLQVVLFVAFLPVILEWTIATTILSSVLEGRLGGPVAIEGVSLGWRTPIEIRGLKLTRDGASEPWLEAPRTLLHPHAWSVLNEDEPFLLAVHEPVVRLRRNPDGSLDGFPRSPSAPDPTPKDPDAHPGFEIPIGGQAEIKIIGARATVNGAAPIKAVVDVRLDGKGSALVDARIEAEDGSSSFTLRAPIETQSLQITESSALLRLEGLGALAPWTGPLDLPVSLIEGEESTVGLLVSGNWTDGYRLVGTMKAALQPDVDLGVSEDRIEATFAGRWKSEGVDELNLEAATSQGRIRIGPAARLDLTDRGLMDAGYEVALPDPGVLAAFLPEGMAITGPVALRGQAAGSLGTPGASVAEDLARFAGSRISLEVGGLILGRGMPALEDVILDATIAEDHLRIDTLRIRSAGGGTLTSSDGRLALAGGNPEGNLTLALDAWNLDAWLAGSDLPLDASGTLEFSGGVGSWTGTGDLIFAARPGADPALWSGEHALSLRAQGEPELIRVEELQLRTNAGLQAELTAARIPLADPMGARGLLRIEADAALASRLEAVLGEPLPVSPTGATTVRLDATADGPAAITLTVPALVMKRADGGDTRIPPARFQARVLHTEEGTTLEGARLVGDGIVVDLPGVRREPKGTLSIGGDYALNCTRQFLAEQVSPLLPGTWDFRDALVLDGDVAFEIAEDTELLATLSGSSELRLGTATWDGRPLEGVMAAVSLPRGTQRAGVRLAATLDGGPLTARGQIPLEPRSGGEPGFLVIETTGWPIDLTTPALMAPEGTNVRTTTTASGKINVGLPEGLERIEAGLDLNIAQIARSASSGQRASVPATRLRANGQFLAASGAVTVRSLRWESGEGQGALRFSAGNVRLEGEDWAYQSLGGQIPAGVIDALLLGGTSEVSVTGDTSLRIRSTAPDALVPLGQLPQGEGELSIARLNYDGLPMGPARVPITVRDERIQPKEAVRIPVSGGTLELGAGTVIDLARGRHRLEANLQEVAIAPVMAPALSLGLPLLAAGEGGGALTGSLGGNLAIGADLGRESWWEGIDGTIAIDLSSTRVVGSRVLDAMSGDLGSALGGGNVLTQLLGGSASRDNPIAQFATNGFDLPQLNLAFRIERGVVRPVRPIAVPIGEFTFEVSGTARLDGALDYEIGTNVLERLAAKAMSGRRRNPLGGILGAIDPLRALLKDSLKLQVTGRAYGAEADANPMRVTLRRTSGGR